MAEVAAARARMTTTRHKRPGLMERLSSHVSQWTGSTAAFVAAFGLILAWVVTGPLFGFSDTWQLVINTSTTIITFLMVFVIQRAQNKESRAVELKLNELIAAMEQASNRLIDVEDLSEEELDALHARYQQLAGLAEREATFLKSHTIEEAEQKERKRRKPPHHRPRRRTG
jgi:low affinity Fe/Cu permease